MIKKYHIDFNNRKKSQFKKATQLLKNLLSKKKVKSNLSFAPKWNHIKRKKGVNNLIHKYIHLPHINKKSMVLSTSILLVIASFLFNFYLSIGHNQVGLASDFVYTEQSTVISSENSKSSQSSRSLSNDIEEVEDSNQARVIFAGTGRLYFQNEGDILVDYDNSLKTNKNFNSDIFPGEQGIEIIWDQIYNSDIEIINAKRCLFYIYGFDTGELIVSGSSVIENSKCKFILDASDQLDKNIYNISTKIIDVQGFEYDNNKILIINENE